MRIVATFAVLSALAVSACGFTPMYAEPAVGSSLRRIAVTTQDDRLGYRLREQLEDALAWDRSATPLYRLTTQVRQNRRSLGRRIDDTATRYELTVKATWTLTPAAAGGTPVSGTETVTTTYAAADQPYAAIAAQQDGEERAASELARLIRLDLMQALSNP
ncbi:LPS assembly lipoprotein LptE [Brevundimonas sp.]|uniref:LPS assembly lipoprotein LptE n=1 Tax=Brevundimonas sp. TaxID=1871086 RepID=UPI00356399CC